MNQIESITVLSAATAASFGVALLAQWAVLRAMFRLLPRVTPVPRLATAATLRTRIVQIPRIPAVRLQSRPAG
jgi:hypothetical protein